MKNSILIPFILFFLGCNTSNTKVENNTVEAEPVQFEQKHADYLYNFAFHCIDHEYPNKTGHVMSDSSDQGTPSGLHPAFYGCFDWHSSVHGHWTLVNILNAYPQFEYREYILDKLKRNITAENIKTEVAYFDSPNNSNFERTYGWAWLFKLQEALNEWDDPEAKEMSEALAPLTLLLENKMIEFLDKLSYPIRVGEHPNTAFGLSFSLDYARSQGRTDLEAKIVEKAREYYMKDAGCPLTWEPGGFDFLSPCLQEASLMLKVLPADEFRSWMDSFLPGFLEDPEQYLQPATVSDRADGKIAHLDGLNFSRAWCLYEIGLALENPRLIQLANTHFNSSYDKIDSW